MHEHMNDIIIPSSDERAFSPELQRSEVHDLMYSVFFSDLVEFLNLDLPRFYYLNEEQRKELLNVNKDLFKKKIPIIQFFKYYYHVMLPKKVNTFVKTDSTYKEFIDHITNLKTFMKNKYGINLKFNYT